MKWQGILQLPRIEYLVLQSTPTHVNEVVMKWQGILQLLRIEYSRGETYLNSFIHQVMFSSGIIARVCMGLRDIFQFAFFVSSQTRKINANNRNINKK